ncbi:Transcriptional regulator, AraC family [Alloalcanivorax xenomutans]|uniref:AraC family transcriptional regulator n=1 Tax=Alloalcanivorax xenomutans TaxID=1094342 RepID=UPI0006D5C4EA|nr:AraC family transcriptional regulator [Alloalcanivorax xenomutans]CUR46465.1 Transcriptional regulator, AraC family [Alloalcanivorax xenomutans]
MSSLIRATNLWGYDDLVRELGADPERFLGRFHIPPARQRSDDDFFSYRTAALLLETTAVELACPDFGLRLASWQGLEMLGPLAVIARNSGTVLEGFQAIARYLHVHCPALLLRLDIPKNRHGMRFDYHITELSAPQLRQSYELSLANAMRILRMLAGERVCPSLVSFQHRQVGPSQTYERIFGCDVLFEQDWCGWWLPAALASKNVDHANAQTLHYATTYLESKHAPGSIRLPERVRELIRRLLPTGQCAAETIAGELAMHPRTMQRRLAEEGVCYEDLLDQERRAQAERFLSQSGLRLVQITGLLGYTEQSTFNRSCRRWFGMTPRSYREALKRSMN